MEVFTVKEIQLIRLELTNFKRIKHFILDADGENIRVYGDNATGKTSLFDAFVWLLFDKDSQNKKDFEIKTLINGKVQHKLNHEVEAFFLVDNKELALKKVFSEKWTKKRGSVTKEFTGHTTDYFIDGVPSKKKEYTETVASLVEEEIFKLLTSPSYFNEQMHWKDRRNLLLEIAGDVSDEEVIAADKKLVKLSDIIVNRSIDDHKKVIAAKRKEINQELDRIPIRIDEIHRGLPDVSGLDQLDLQAEIDSLSNQIEEKQQRINDIKSGGEVSKLRTQINDIDLEISNLRNEHKQQEQQAIYSLKAKLQEEQSNIGILQSKVGSHENRISMNNSNIKNLETRMNDLRNQWKEQNDLEFDHESNCKCPTCEQELPQEQVTEIATKFNLEKANKLESINAEGRSLKAQVEELQEENETLNKKIDKIVENGKKKAKDIEKLKADIEKAENEVKPIEENPTYQKLMEDRQALEQQIKDIESSVQDSVNSINDEVRTLKEQQNTLQMDLNKFAQEIGRASCRERV